MSPEVYRERICAEEETKYKERKKKQNNKTTPHLTPTDIAVSLTQLLSKPSSPRTNRPHKAMKFLFKYKLLRMRVSVICNQNNPKRCMISQSRWNLSRFLKTGLQKEKLFQAWGITDPVHQDWTRIVFGEQREGRLSVWKRRVLSFDSPFWRLTSHTHVCRLSMTTEQELKDSPMELK